MKSEVKVAVGIRLLTQGIVPPRQDIAVREHLGPTDTGVVPRLGTSILRLR